MTDLAERGSLGVRELEPPLQLGLQDAIFGGQIFNPRFGRGRCAMALLRQTQNPD
jgi:hypothetical protein